MDVVSSEESDSDTGTSGGYHDPSEPTEVIEERTRSGSPNPFAPSEDAPEQGVEIGTDETSEQAQSLEQQLIEESPYAQDADDVVVERQDGKLVAGLTEHRRGEIAAQRFEEQYDDAERQRDYTVSQEDGEFVARPTNFFERRQAEEQLESQLEQRIANQQYEDFSNTGQLPDVPDLEAGEDFEVERTDDGWRGTLTRNEGTSLAEQVQFSDEDTVSDLGDSDRVRTPRTSEEEFLSGVLSSVGIENPPRQEDIGEGIQNLIGASNTSTVSEAADEELGETDDQIRQGRENVSRAATDSDSPYNVVDNLVEGLDNDNEVLPFMRPHMTDEEIREFEENQPKGSAPAGAAAVGPGGAVRGVAGGARLLGSTDDLLKGAGIVGTASAAGVASQEIDVPQEEDRNELDVTGSASPSELGVPDDTTQAEITTPTGPTFTSELEPGETVQRKEISIPNEGSQSTPTGQGEDNTVVPGDYPLAGRDQPADPTQEHIGRESDEAIVGTSPVVEGTQRQREEEEEDELGVPENDPFRESDRRLYDPQREFGDREDISRSVDPTSEESPSQEDIGSGIAGTGTGFEPARGETVAENFQRYMEEQRQREEQAQRQEVLVRDDVVGRGTLAGTVGEGLFGSELRAEQQAGESLLDRAQERDAVGEEEWVGEDVGQTPDQTTSPFEDTDQDESVGSDDLLDDILDQTPTTDETIEETIQSESVTDEILEDTTTGTPTTTGEGYSYPPTTETRNPPDYGYPGTPTTGTPRPPRRPPTPEQESEDDEIDDLLVGFSDGQFTTGIADVSDLTGSFDSDAGFSSEDWSFDASDF